MQLVRVSRKKRRRSTNTIEPREEYTGLKPAEKVINFVYEDAINGWMFSEEERAMIKKFHNEDILLPMFITSVSEAALLWMNDFS